MQPRRRRREAMKREKQTGTEEYGKFMQRLLRSYGRKAKEGELDITALEQLADIQKQLDEQTAETVMALRAEGESWERIGAALGITKSAAYKRFKGRPGVEDPEGARKAGGQPGSLR